MPLSLLLTQQLTILNEGVRKLGRWEGITDTIALVARRLRSAYLVRWFGTAVPVEGLDVVVTIANVDELQARYRSVMAGNRGATRGGPNLTEPLLGAGGMLAGAFAFPVNAMVLSMVIGGLAGSLWQKLVAALGWVSGGGFLTGLLLVAAPLLAIGLLAQGVGGGAADTVDLLGALATLALPMKRLWDQLSGRAPVRNPLMRQLLLLGDRLAALLAQTLGAVAVVVTRIAPLIYPLVAGARATMGAVHALVPAIGLALGDVVTVLGWLLHGPYAASSVIASVTTAVRGLVQRLSQLVTTTLTTMTGIAVARVGPVLRAVGHYVVSAASLVRQAILDTPFVRWLASVRGLAAAYSHSASRPGPRPAPSSPPSSWRTSFPWPGSALALRTMLAHAPTISTPTLSAPPWASLGAVGPLADVFRTFPSTVPPSPFALSAAQGAELRRFRLPPSIVGDLRAAQARQGRLGGGAEDRLFALAGLLAEVGPRLERTVELVAPDQAASVLPGIEGLLDRIDEQLRRTPAHHPTAALPEPDAIRPVVGRLRVRAPGGPSAADEVGGFVATLRRELDSRTYPVAAQRSRPGSRRPATHRSRVSGGAR